MSKTNPHELCDATVARLREKLRDVRKVRDALKRQVGELGAELKLLEPDNWLLAGNVIFGRANLRGKRCRVCHGSGAVGRIPPESKGEPLAVVPVWQCVACTGTGKAPEADGSVP